MMIRIDEIPYQRKVALRKESVDRNKIPAHSETMPRGVALRKESVDRNNKVA